MTTAELILRQIQLFWSPLAAIADKLSEWAINWDGRETKIRSIECFSILCFLESNFTNDKKYCLTCDRIIVRASCCSTRATAWRATKLHLNWIIKLCSLNYHRPLPLRINLKAWGLITFGWIGFKPTTTQSFEQDSAYVTQLDGIILEQLNKTY